MAEPFTIVAGGTGITAAALHGTRLLLDDLQKIKDAPRTLQRLTDDLSSVERALASLQAVDSQELEVLGANVAEGAKTTVTTCTSACDRFRADLQHWTKHSHDGRLTWRDPANVDFVKQEKIKAMSERLQNCKVTITSVVSIATLYSSARHAQMTEEIRTTISTKQTEIRGSIGAVNGALAALDQRVAELTLTSDRQQVDESIENRAEVLRQLGREREAMATSRKLLDELLSKTQEGVIAQATAKNQSRPTSVRFGNQNSGFQAGVINNGVSGITFGGK